MPESGKKCLIIHLKMSTEKSSTQSVIQRLKPRPLKRMLYCQPTRTTITDHHKTELWLATTITKLRNRARSSHLEEGPPERDMPQNVATFTSILPAPLQGCPRVRVHTRISHSPVGGEGPSGDDHHRKAPGAELARVIGLVPGRFPACPSD